MGFEEQLKALIEKFELLCKRLQSFICPGFEHEKELVVLYLAELKDCRESKQIVLNKLEEYKLMLSDQEEAYSMQIKELAFKVLELTAQLQNVLKPTNVPTANITYSRPVLVGPNKWSTAKVDVRNFVMSDFLIEESVKRLVYDGSQDLDELIPKIYLLAKKNYKYGADSNYGFSEYWMFPYELRHVREKLLAADCDDWANWIGAHLKAANIPRNKWLISCGYTRNNIGHATLYAKDSNSEWRHLNSTKRDYSYADLKKYPSKNNGNDSIGIKPSGFWFSYNDQFSIHQFESTEAEETFNKILGNKVKITGIRNV